MDELLLKLAAIRNDHYDIAVTINDAINALQGQLTPDEPKPKQAEKPKPRPLPTVAQNMGRGYQM